MKKRVLPFALSVMICLGLFGGLSQPAFAAENEYVSTIATGNSCSYAVKADGTLWAWGGNLGGTLGDGTRIDRLTPVKVLDDVKSVDANTFGAYVIKNDNSLWANYEGLTPELKSQYDELQYADSVRTWYKIADDVKEVCGYCMFIKNDNSVWAWGKYNDPRMGLGAGQEKF